MATLQSLLAAIEKDNEKRFKVPASSKRLYTGGKGPAPYTHSKHAVEPKTSKGTTSDGSKRSSGVLGTFKNLASDVEETVRGLPGGVIQTIHDPVGTAKAVGADYKRRYSPLLSGDFGKFAHEIQQHPLAPLLDAASVATGGGALAAKVGQSAKVASVVEKAGAAATAARDAKLVEKAEAVTKPAKASVASLTKRAQKVGIDKDLAEARANNLKAPLDVQQSSARAFSKHENTIAAIQKQIGEASKTIAKTEKRLAKQTAAPAAIESTLPRMLVRLQKATEGGTRYIGASKEGVFKSIPVAQHMNPVKRLRQNLGIAAQESRLIPARTPLVGLESRARKAAGINREDTAARIRYPQRHMIAAITTLEKVGEKTGHANAMATAAQALIDGVAPKDYARLVRDTRSTGDEIQHSIRKGMTQKEHHAETEQLVKAHLDSHAQALYEGARQYMQRESLKTGRVINPIHLQHGFKNKLIDSPEVEAIVKLQRAHETVAHDSMVQMVRNKMLKPDVASQQAVLHVNLARAAKGLKEFTPAEAKVYYDKAGLPTPSYNPDVLTVGDAKLKAGMLKESGGKLYARGTRINNPMNIVMRNELASKATDVAYAHRLMLSAARKIPAGKDLPKGYIWIKDTLAPSLDQKEVIFKQQFVDGKPVTKSYLDLMETEKRPMGGYAINKKAADDLAAGRAAMTAARNETMARAITAWKYLVLFRPAFVVHNVLSNQAMYHLKNGWNFAAFKNMREAFKSGAFDQHHHSEGLSFSEDVLGKPKGKASKAANIFYKVTAQHEHWLRQLTAYETARKMPQVQREIARLKGGKLDTSQQTLFHQAYNAAIEKHPHIRDLVTRNMDDTLGNYRYYTQLERQLKNLSPFYGWERHSVRNMVRMMEDNPATMAMLTQIGMVGHDKWNKDFGPGMPAFVRNYVQDSYIQTIAQHLGLGDNVSMYDFNSTNPWSTALDVGEAATGDKAALLGLAGPLVTAPAEAIFQKSALTGAPTKSRFDKYSPIAGAIDRVVTGTPPVTTFDALTSDSNEKKKMLKTSDAGIVARQFGGDFRQLDKTRAKAQVSKSKQEFITIPVNKKKKKNPFYK